MVQIGPPTNPLARQVGVALISAAGVAECCGSVSYVASRVDPPRTATGTSAMIITTQRVSPLRQLMIEEMQLHQLAPKTRQACIRAVLHFTRYLRRARQHRTALSVANGSGLLVSELTTLKAGDLPGVGYRKDRGHLEKHLGHLCCRKRLASFQIFESRLRDTPARRRGRLLRDRRTGCVVCGEIDGEVKT